jgi:hypothetical protein
MWAFLESKDGTEARQQTFLQKIKLVQHMQDYDIASNEGTWEDWAFKFIHCLPQGLHRLLLQKAKTVF